MDLIQSITPALPKKIIVCGPGDVHLGTENRVSALTELLAHIDCEQIIFNGDLFDSGKLARLKERDIHFLELIEKKRAEGVKIVHILGNHDQMFGRLIGAWPFAGSSWNLCEEYLFEYRGAKYYFVHGDQFDRFVRTWRRAGYLAGEFYYFLKKLESEEQKFASKVKSRSKKWLHVSRAVEAGVAALAVEKGAQYAFAGHTHMPLQEKLNGVEYMNLGAFVDKISSFFTIDEKGVPRLHIIEARKKLQKKVTSPEVGINIDLGMPYSESFRTIDQVQKPLALTGGAKR